MLYSLIDMYNVIIINESFNSIQCTNVNKVLLSPSDITECPLRRRFTKSIDLKCLVILWF